MSKIWKLSKKQALHSRETPNQYKAFTYEHVCLVKVLLTAACSPEQKNRLKSLFTNANGIMLTFIDLIDIIVTATAALTDCQI